MIALWKEVRASLFVSVFGLSNLFETRQAFHSPSPSRNMFVETVMSHTLGFKTRSNILGGVLMELRRVCVPGARWKHTRLAKFVSGEASYFHLYNSL